LPRGGRRVVRQCQQVSWSAPEERSEYRGSGEGNEGISPGREAIAKRSLASESESRRNDAGGGPEGSETNKREAAQSGRSTPARVWSFSGAVAGKGLRGVPHRFAYCGRRAAGAKAASDSRPPDRRRGCRGSDDGIADGIASWRFVAGRSRWDLSALP